MRELTINEIGWVGGGGEEGDARDTADVIGAAIEGGLAGAATGAVVGGAAGTFLAPAVGTAGGALVGAVALGLVGAIGGAFKAASDSD